MKDKIPDDCITELIKLEKKYNRIKIATYIIFDIFIIGMLILGAFI